MHFLRFVFLFFILSLSLVSYSQHESTFEVNVEQIENNEEVWKDLVFIEGELKVQVRKEDCIYNAGFDKQILLLHFTNLSDHTITLSYDEELYYNDVCKTCGIDEYARFFSLEAGQILQGECNVIGEPGTVIFVKSIDKMVEINDHLTKYVLANLTIE